MENRAEPAGRDARRHFSHNLMSAWILRIPVFSRSLTCRIPRIQREFRQQMQPWP